MRKEIMIKQILVPIPMIFLSVVVNGQTSLDTLLFSKINGYRASKRLKQVKWDTTGYSGCSNAVTTREQGIRGVKNHLVVSTFVFR